MAYSVQIQGHQNLQVRAISGALVSARCSSLSRPGPSLGRLHTFVPQNIHQAISKQPRLILTRF
eukprot:6182455-Pleurochrysis_carterae.AAC.2